MEFFRVSVEGHRHSLTVYVAGLLCERARVELERIVAGASATTRALRVDLRAVHVIDPAAFTHVARALAAWRDRSGGRVTIEFPERTVTRGLHRGFGAARFSSAGEALTIGKRTQGLVSVRASPALQTPDPRHLTPDT